MDTTTKKPPAEVCHEIEAEIIAAGHSPDASVSAAIGRKILAAVSAYPEAPELARLRSMLARGLEQWKGHTGKPH